MFSINFAAMLKTLPIMLFGMLGIFIVMVAIYVVISLFGRFSKKGSE